MLSALVRTATRWLGFVAAAATLAVSPALALDHGRWNDLLAAHITPGADGVNRFDYAGLKANPAAMANLEAYIAEVEATRISALTRDEQFAAWANLYNALTVRLMVSRWPVRSIMNIRPTLVSIGPWKMPITTIEGRRMSLDDIEHATLRQQWQEPRVHYAVNCASIGCPNLQAEAFTAANLERMLDAGARAYVNHPRGVRIVRPGQVRVSNIYNWFKEDFGGNPAGILAHLRQYAGPELSANLEGARIVGYDYDWAVNAP
jgi:hypothetical protein